MSVRSFHDGSFRQLLDAAPDAVVIIDRLGHIVMVNREVERLFGWTEQEYRPPEVAQRTYYEPSPHGFEEEIARRMRSLREDDQ